MGLNLKAGQVLFLDTSPIIYFFEGKEPFIKVMDGIFDMIYELDIQVVTSFISYIEVLTAPTKIGNTLLAAKYRDFLSNSEQISIYPLDISVADKTVYYRSKYNLRTPDAVQLAVAELCGSDFVLTNDKDWGKVSEVNVQILEKLIG